MYKNIISVLLLTALMAGCQKDPSLVSPKDAYSTSNYPATLSDLNSVLAASYSNLRDAGMYGFHFLPKALSNSMHAVNSAYNGDPSWNEMANTNLAVTNQYAFEAWQVYFTGVKNCNVTLKSADFYESKFAKAGEKTQIDYVRGQAYFLRAFYYFQLETLYGEDNTPNPTAKDTMGVPLFSSVPATLEASQQARSSIKAVWAQIVNDLKQSATLLKGQTWTGNDVGRVSEWSAKGMLGKAYVFTKDWANAKTTLQDVIANSGKTLMPFSKYKDAFVGIPAAEFNEESLFELNIDQDSKGNYGVYGDNANATTINGLIWCPWALVDGTEGNSQPMGYGNEIFHEKNVERFGYDLGSYTLVPNPNYDANYKPEKDGYITDKWPATIMKPSYKQDALTARAAKAYDPRLTVNALQPWIDSVMYDGKNWYRVAMPNFYAGQAGKYGWSLRKYSPVFNNINNVGPADATNLYLLRMADVYLLYAEACANSSDNVNALEYLNKVKRRAYGFPISTPSPVDYASLNDATAADIMGDPVLGHNPLYYERWAELFNEGEWWQDVCRWHIGPSEAAYYGTALNLNGPIQFDTKKSYTWPIPLNEINSNAKIANQQNPGY